jgi:hypothetical protein
MMTKTVWAEISCINSISEGKSQARLGTLLGLRIGWKNNAERKLTGASRHTVNNWTNVKQATSQFEGLLFVHAWYCSPLLAK